MRTRSFSFLSATILLLILFSLTACTSAEGRDVGEPRGDVSLRANAVRYAPGDEVHVILENRSQDRVGYNICFAFLNLERREEGAWKPISTNLGPDPLAGCTTILRSMQPGGSANGRAYLPDDLPSGIYRITHAIEINDGQRQVIATEGFEVESS